MAPYWQSTRTTGYGRCILIAARDLFRIEDINDRTNRLLSERVSAANRPGWYQEVLKQKARIDVAVLDGTGSLRGESLQPDPRFFILVTRFDYIIMASRREDLSYVEKVTGVSINSLADLERALEKAVKDRISEGLAGIKCALAYERSLSFNEVSRDDANRTFDKLFASPASSMADPAAQKMLQDYMLHKLIQQAAEHHLPVQIHRTSKGDRSPSGGGGIWNRAPAR